MSSTYPWDGLQGVQSEWIPTEKGQLHCVSNAGIANANILFLHGVLRNWKSYYTILPALQSLGVNVALLDFRGHGGSMRVPEAYRVIDYVQDAMAFLEMVREPIVLYGHSLGAMVALGAASLNPRQVHKLVMEDPPFETMGSRLLGTALGRYFTGVEQCLIQHPMASEEELFHGFSEIVVGQHPDGRPLRMRDQRDEQSRRFSAMCLKAIDAGVLKPITNGQWLRGCDWTEWCRRVSIDTTILQADEKHGGMLTDSDAELLQRSMGTKCRVLRFVDTGHSIHWQHPNRTIELLRTIVA